MHILVIELNVDRDETNYNVLNLYVQSFEYDEGGVLCKESTARHVFHA